MSDLFIFISISVVPGITTNAFGIFKKFLA